MEEENKQVEEKIEEEVETSVEEKVVEEKNVESPKEIPKKAKENLIEEIEIPEGLNAELGEDVLIIKKDDKKNERRMNALVDVKIEGNKIIISCKRNRKTERKLFGTMKAHVRNMIKGLSEGFHYKLAIANVHFPMNVSFDKNTNSVVVKNFLGEKKDRVIKLIEGPEIKVNKEDIEITYHDIEMAGDCATKIEKGTKVRNKDRRIYQDGIFIVEKPGRVYLK